VTPDRRRRSRGRTPGGVRDPRAAEGPGATGTAGAADVTGVAGVTGAGGVAGAAGVAGTAGASGVSDDPYDRARQVCLRLLTLAPRTSAQLADAMRRKGVPAEAAEAVLSRLAEVGLIDDAAFARAWVESRHHARGLSRRALSLELERRGVPGEDVQAAVSALDPDAEVATARRLVAKAMPGTRGREPQARIRRLVGLLARRGYPAPLAYRVVREALEQEGVDAEDVGIDLDSIDLDSLGENSGAGHDTYE
jgi:regulatory protein